MQALGDDDLSISNRPQNGYKPGDIPTRRSAIGSRWDWKRQCLFRRILIQWAAPRPNQRGGSTPARGSNQRQRRPICITAFTDNNDSIQRAHIVRKLVRYGYGPWQRRY